MEARPVAHLPQTFQLPQADTLKASSKMHNLIDRIIKFILLTSSLGFFMTLLFLAPGAVVTYVPIAWQDTCLLGVYASTPILTAVASLITIKHLMKV